MSPQEPTTQPVRLEWVIVGCGRVGTTLALLAERLGVHVRVAWSRSTPSADVPADLRLSEPLETLEGRLAGAAVWLTVTDEAIASVAASLAKELSRAEVVVHCSGSLSSRVLTDAGVTAPVGSIHPLLAIADPARAVDRLSKCAWTIEGDAEALWFARGMLSQIDVEPVTIAPDAKTLYHAAAVTSAGLVVSLMDAAFAVAEAAGIERDDAREMLLPLARFALENLEEQSTFDALTGPVARDDRRTITRHLEALADIDDESAREIYRLLTERMSE